eukprot:Colp12_sorted_trinity150504_noHs@3799
MVLALVLVLYIYLSCISCKSEACFAAAPLANATEHDLVVLVLSGHNSVASRDAIRATWKTWSNNEYGSVLVRFMLGAKDMPEKVQDTLIAENMQYEDMLFLDVVDAYDNLARRVHAGFCWAVRNTRKAHVLKVDDDSFINIPALLKELQGLPQEKLYWGYFDGRAPVFKEGKWGEQEYIFGDRYLPYALGGGYLLSRDIVETLCVMGPLLKFYKSEDVSVGTWTAGLDLNRVHDTRFDTEFKSRGCQNTWLVTHKQSPADTQEKFDTIESTGSMCKVEMIKRGWYEYNWHVPPAECCVKKPPAK